MIATSERLAKWIRAAAADGDGAGEEALAGALVGLAADGPHAPRPTAPTRSRPRTILPISPLPQRSGAIATMTAIVGAGPARVKGATS